MAPKPKLVDDQACIDLAEHFMADVKGHTAKHVRDLAEAFQEAAEDHCSMAEADAQQDQDTERTAKCAYCNATRPSSEWEQLAFFENRGDGTKWATDHCACCGYTLSAHTVEGMANNVPSNRRTVVEQGKCPGFIAKGPWEHDSYYCGCRGWD